MNSRASKRHAATKNGVSSTVKKRLPAYKRQPDLYYSHVWLDREIYAQVLAFIGWERQKKYSVKMAVRILLELGLKHYIIDQINLAKKRKPGQRRKDKTRRHRRISLKICGEGRGKWGFPPLCNTIVHFPTSPGIHLPCLRKYSALSDTY